MDIIKTIVIVSLLSSMLLSGCNSTTSPIDNHGTDEEVGSITGTWLMTQMTFEVGTTTYTVMASDSQQLTLTFNEDFTYHQKQISTSSGVSVTTEENGTYAISGSNLIQTSKTGLQTSGKYSHSGNEMILTSTKISQGQTYTTVYHFRHR